MVWDGLEEMGHLRGDIGSISGSFVTAENLHKTVRTICANSGKDPDIDVEILAALRWVRRCRKHPHEHLTRMQVGRGIMGRQHGDIRQAWQLLKISTESVSMWYIRLHEDISGNTWIRSCVCFSVEIFDNCAKCYTSDVILHAIRLEYVYWICTDTICQITSTCKHFGNAQYVMHWYMRQVSSKWYKSEKWEI